jgi:RNA polymerase sigma-70 factor, ECF subfamily
MLGGLCASLDGRCRFRVVWNQRSRSQTPSLLPRSESIATNMAASTSDLDTSDLNNEDERFTTGSTASDLLTAAKRFEPLAWREVVDRYSWLIVRWCRHEGLSTDDAPDVLQAVLLRVVQHLGTFEKDGRTAAFRRWLRALTRSQVAEFRRNAARQPRSDGGSSAQQRSLALAEKSPKAAASPRLDLLLDRFWKLVERLEESFEPSTWQAFWLTTFENLNSAEAAQVLDMTPAAVRLAKARVVHRIRREDADLANELKTVKERE